MEKSKKWNNEEIKFLKNNYNLFSIQEVANKLNRSYNSVNLKASKLGATNPNHFWKRDELIFLKENYGKILTKDIAIRLNRGLSAIKIKAYQLGLMNISNREKTQFKKGHDTWNKGMRGVHFSPETEFKKGEDRISGKNHHNFRKKLSKTTRDKISETRKRLYREGKLEPYLVGPEIFKKLNKEPEFVKKKLNGLLKRPTSYEQKISNLCFKYNLPFIYKGNGDFLINFKNPDFINEKEKIAIEVFYSWFKIRDYGSVENYKEYCRKRYEPAGWKVIFIDETEVNVDNWEEICLNKILNFFKINSFMKGGND